MTITFAIHAIAIVALAEAIHTIAKNFTALAIHTIAYAIVNSIYV
jgi:hypothetical protein